MFDTHPVFNHPPRINEALLQYWQTLRGTRILPLEPEISAEALKDIWDSCFLVSIRPDGSFAYDYLGRDLIAAYGDDLTGREITEKLVYPHPPSLFAAFQRVARSGEPAMDENAFTNSTGSLVKYRSCVLPFGAKDRADVAFLLGGMKWKAS